MNRSVLTVDSFFKEANLLRGQFEQTFANPRAANPERFVWDYWHVPGQYTQLRTPAYHFFPKKSYEAFHNHLVWWGRRTLGCHDVSPPWMSCYLEGHGQELHGDLPHGPWAFVFSLTPWTKRKFRGGQTILLKEEILSYWKGFISTRGLEQNDILDEVEPKFNRLTVFDPRIPHGVRKVEGVHDVTEGRLVIHGWFVQPRPFIEGPITPRELQGVIDQLGENLGKLIEEGLDLHGLLSVRIDIQPSGEVSGVKTLASSLRHSGGDERFEKALVRQVGTWLKAHRFSKKPKPSQITLPLIFEAIQGTKS